MATGSCLHFTHLDTSSRLHGSGVFHFQYKCNINVIILAVQLSSDKLCCDVE